MTHPDRRDEDLAEVDLDPEVENLLEQMDKILWPGDWSMVPETYAEDDKLAWEKLGGLLRQLDATLRRRKKER